MTNGFIALIGAIGAAGWAYSKANRRTGGNTQSALVVAAITAVAMGIVMLTLLSVLDNYLSR